MSHPHLSRLFLLTWTIVRDLLWRFYFGGLSFPPAGLWRLNLGVCQVISGFTCVSDVSQPCNLGLLRSRQRRWLFISSVCACVCVSVCMRVHSEVHSSQFEIKTSSLSSHFRPLCPLPPLFRLSVVGRLQFLSACHWKENTNSCRLTHPHRLAQERKG